MAEFALGVAELGTVVDMTGLKDGIDDAENAAQSGFSKIGDIIGGALQVGLAAAAGGFVALGAAIAGGVSDAREAAGLMAQTEAAITSTGGAAGKTAEQIADLAASLSAAEGKSLFGDSDIQLAENLLLTFTNLKGEIFDSATAISVDMAQALGGAPKDQAIALGKALNDPIAGITALTRVGVTFTEQQKAQIEAMVKAGDVASAQKVILAELNKEFGGSAAAAAKADGGLAQFRDRMGEIAEGVGAQLLPMLNRAFGFLNSAPVQTAIQKLADGLVAFIRTAVNAGQALLELGAQAFQWGRNITTQLGRGIMQAAAPVIQALQYIGSIIRSWLQPGSPPKLLPNLDEWGAGAATAYMDGWKDADFSAFRSLSQAIEQELKTLVDLGQLSEVDVAPTMTRSQEQLARAIATVNAGGEVQGEVWDSLISAMGPAGPQVAALVRSYLDLQRATQQVEQAQRELTEVTERYDAALRPLNAQIQGIRDRKREIQDMQRVQELQEKLAGGELDAAEAELAQLEIAEIQAQQQIDSVERERDAAVDAAQAKVDAAETAQQAAQAQIQTQQGLLDQGHATNQLLVSQGELLARLAKEAEGAGGGAGGAAGGMADMASSMDAAIQPIQDVAAAVDDAGQQVEAIKGRFTDAAGSVLAFASTAGSTLSEVSLPIQTIRALADQAFPAIAESASLAFGIVSAAVRDNGAQMLADAGTIWEGLRATVDTIASAVAQTVALVFGQITIFLREHGDEIAVFLGQAWNSIASIITVALELIQGIVTGVFLVMRDFIAAHGEDIQTILSGAWLAISSIITAALTLIEGVLKAALAIFKGDWQGAWEALQQMALGFAESIARAVQGMLEIIAGFFETSLQEIADTWRHNFEMLPGIVTQLRDLFVAAGRALVMGVVAGVMASAAQLYETLKNMALGALQAAQDALLMHSPSRLFMDLGSNIIASWVLGLEESFPSLLSSFAAMGEELADLAQKIKDTIADTMADIFEGGADLIEQRIKNREFVAGLGKDVVKEREKNTADIAKTEAALADAREKEVERQAKLQEQIAEKQKQLQKELALPAEKQDLERIADLQRDLADLEKDRAAPSERVTELENELALLRQQSTELAERERQMESFRQRQAGLLQQAEQAGAMLFKDDPERQADFFQMRSKQLQDIAKLEEEWFAARTQAERDQIEAMIRDKQKQHELELAAFMLRAQQENATFGDLQKQYDDLVEKRDDLTTKRTEKQTQLAKEKDATRRAELEREIADLDQQIAGTTALINEMQQILDPLAGIVTTPPTVPAQGLYSGAGIAYPTLPNVNGIGAGQLAGAAANANAAYTVVLRLEDERSSLFKDLIRAEVRDEMTEAGWRGDTRKR